MTEQVLSEHDNAPVIYLRVLIGLLILTAATVAISFVPLTGIWHIVLGLIIALIKGSLVILFFMHVLHSKPLTILVIGFAAVFLGILLILTMNDYVTRGMLGFPGH